MTNEAKLAQAVGTILKELQGHAVAVIAEKELVRRVLEFANTGRPEGLPGAHVMTQGARSYLVLTEELPAQHGQLQKDLAAIVEGELSGPAAARLRKQASRQVLVPSFEFERGRGLQTRYRHLLAEADEGGQPESQQLPTLLAYVLLSILSHKDLSSDVRQCRLPSCGRFFLVSDLVKDPTAAGRRRDRYCTKDHMSQAQGTSAERTRRWRENKLKRAPKAAPKNR